MATALRLATVAAFVLGVLALALPDRPGAVAASGMVIVLVSTPLARVGWLTARWCLRRDWRFAAAGAALLVVVALGSLTH
jgi:UDP-N-acetylmuramyl pentapeptide phosphotransferase/UDP-N-acetylglucosamine-1-phosphate transferase